MTTRELYGLAALAFLLARVPSELPVTPELTKRLLAQAVRLSADWETETDMVEALRKQP